MKAQRRKVALAGSCVLAILLIAQSIVLRREPVGYFNSIPVMGNHADDDVLHFKNGVVTWETGCGTESVGTYSRTNGNWIWTFQTGRKGGTTNRLLLRPGVFWLTCVDPARPTREVALTRRLFSPAHEDEEEPAAERPTALPPPATPLLRDAQAVIARTTNGPVVMEQLPESIRALGPTRAVVIHRVLVLYTAATTGKILNPAGGRSIPAINRFMISPDPEPGVFNFEAF